MDVDNILHMNGGVGRNSYVNNSLLQRAVIMKVKPILEKSIKELYHALSPDCLMVADMGCSCGPNSLQLVSEVINAVDDVCWSTKQRVPKFSVFLNDLPGNDFNTLFQLFHSFNKRLEKEKGKDFGPCFVSGTPGSFYGRVFPDKILHFVHSSYSLHWLSQVPKGLETDNGTALNEKNICLAKSSLPEVSEAYCAQFKRDFTLFLSSRAAEMVPGGRMLLTFLGSINHDYPGTVFELLGSTLQAMVLEGLIEEENLEKCNMPYYLPTVKEVRQLVENEGSFDLNELKTFSLDWSVDTKQTLDNRAKFVANCIRAVGESFLTNAFGEAVIHELFKRFQANVKERMCMDEERTEYLNIVVSMTKRD